MELLATDIMQIADLGLTGISLFLFYKIIMTVLERVNARIDKLTEALRENTKELHHTHLKDDC